MGNVEKGEKDCESNLFSRPLGESYKESSAAAKHSARTHWMRVCRKLNTRSAYFEWCNRNDGEKEQRVEHGQEAVDSIQRQWKVGGNATQSQQNYVILLKPCATIMLKNQYCRLMAAVKPQQQRQQALTLTPFWAVSFEVPFGVRPFSQNEPFSQSCL